MAVGGGGLWHHGIVALWDCDCGTVGGKAHSLFTVHCSLFIHCSFTVHHFCVSVDQRYSCVILNIECVRNSGSELWK